MLVSWQPCILLVEKVKGHLNISTRNHTKETLSSSVPKASSGHMFQPEGMVKVWGESGTLLLQGRGKPLSALPSCVFPSGGSSQKT